MNSKSADTAVRSMARGKPFAGAVYLLVNVFCQATHRVKQRVSAAVHDSAMDDGEVSAQEVADESAETADD